MKVSFASVPNEPGSSNEDYVLANLEIVVLLDGAGMSPDVDTGCEHGVPWFVRTLGVGLLGLAGDRRIPLVQALRRAIQATALAHADTCDPLHPLSPSSTIVAFRATTRRAEWLVLGDSTLVLSTHRGLEAVADQRLKEHASQQRSALRQGGGYDAENLWRDLVAAERRLRNRPDGYWIAAGEPAAAHHALTGSLSIKDVDGALLLSDGAARPVHPFGVTSWERCFEWISTRGPSAWLDHVREIENADPDRTRWPRSKQHDDATVAHVLL